MPVQELCSHSWDPCAHKGWSYILCPCAPSQGFRSGEGISAPSVFPSPPIYRHHFLCCTLKTWLAPLSDSSVLALLLALAFEVANSFLDLQASFPLAYPSSAAGGAVSGGWAVRTISLPSHCCGPCPSRRKPK